MTTACSLGFGTDAGGGRGALLDSISWDGVRARPQGDETPAPSRAALHGPGAQSLVRRQARPGFGCVGGEGWGGGGGYGQGYGAAEEREGEA